MLSLKPPGSSEHSRASSPVPPGTHSGGVSPTVAGGPSTSTDPPLLGMVANALKMHHPDEPLSLSVGLDKKGQPKKKEDVRQIMLNSVFTQDLEMLTEIIKTSPQENISAVAMSLVVLLQSQNRVEDYLKKLIKTKLDSLKGQGVHATTNLLRDNTVPVMMIMAFALMEGEDFMRATLGNALATILESPVHVEVNPAKESDLDLIEQSVRTLQACCDSIMDSLQSKRDLIPASFRRLCHFIRVNVEEALGSDAHAGETDESLAPSQKVLSAFMFLRLIVPTVMAPVEKALFLPSQVPSNKAGSLVYVSKILTSLANGSYHKEEYMLPFNDFIKKSLPNMKDFLNYISQPSNEPAKKHKAMESAYLETAVYHLYFYLQAVLPKVEERPPPEHLQDRVSKLRAVVAPEKKDSLRFKGLKALTLSSQNKKKLLESAPVILESGTATVSRSAVKKSGSMGDLREDEVKQEAGRAQSEDEGGDEDAFDDMPSLSHVPVMSDEKRKELLARANLAGSGSAAAAKESALIASIKSTVGPRRGSVLPVFGRRPSGDEYKGDMLAYLQRGQTSFQNLKIQSECWDLIAPFLGVIWEGIVRDAIGIYRRRTFTVNTQHTVSLGDLENAMKQLIPVTLAYFSELFDPAKHNLGITAGDLCKDAQELAVKSPDLVTTLEVIAGGKEAPLVFDKPAGERLAQLVSYVYYDCLLLCIGPVTQAGGKSIAPTDIVNAIHSNQSLIQLVQYCLGREKKMPFFNAIPSFLKSPLTPEQTPPMKSSPLVVEPTLTADDDKSTGVSSAHSSKPVSASSSTHESLSGLGAATTGPLHTGKALDMKKSPSQPQDLGAPQPTSTKPGHKKNPSASESSSSSSSSGFKLGHKKNPSESTPPTAAAAAVVYPSDSKEGKDKEKSGGFLNRVFKKSSTLTRNKDSKD